MQVLATVFVFTLFFLIHPWAALIVTIIIGMIDVDLLALMVIWDLNIDSVTVINLVMAIGFAVDYSAHIAHSFMMKTYANHAVIASFLSVSGSRNKRMASALHDMGISVLLGGFSTFLGIFFLAFGSVRRNTK